MPAQSRFQERAEEVLKLKNEVQDKIDKLTTARDDITKMILSLESASASSGMVALGDAFYKNEGRRKDAKKAWEEARNQTTTCNIKLTEVKEKLHSLMQLCEVCHKFFDLAKKNVNLIPALQVGISTGLDFKNLQIGLSWFEATSGTIWGILLAASIAGKLSAAVPVIGALVLVAVVFIGAAIVGKQRKDAFNDAEDKGKEAVKKAKDMLQKIQELNGTLDTTFTTVWEQLRTAGWPGDNTHDRIVQKCREMMLDLDCASSGLGCYNALMAAPAPVPAETIQLAVVGSMRNLNWTDEAKWSLVLIEHAMQGLTGSESHDVTAVVERLRQQNIQVDPKAIAAAKVKHAEVVLALEEASTSAGSSPGGYTSG